MGTTGYLSDFSASGNPFYVSFEIAAGDPIIIQNNIPVEGCSEDRTILLTKMAENDEVVIGDVVQYIVTAENTVDTPINGVDLVDNIPGGFHYVERSAQLVRAGADGSLNTPDDEVLNWNVTQGDPIVFEDVDFAGNENIEIRYFLRATSGVVEGNYVNTVRAVNAGGFPVSNSAQATVRVVQDPHLQKSILIGKVFHDRDGDGFQDHADATGVVLKSGTVGWHGKRIGTIKGRASQAEPIEGSTVTVRMPMSEYDENRFHIVSREGTILWVSDDGGITEAHKGAKKRGETSQDLRVSMEREGDELVITLVNHGFHEEGIPGVRLATVEGILVETDANGRYHLADIDGGRFERGRNHIIKLDTATVPEGSQVTTENPRVIRVTQGLMSRVNFGVKLPAVEPANAMQTTVIDTPIPLAGALLPAKPTVQQAEVREVSIAMDRIHFDTARHFIKPTYMQELQSLLDEYGEKPNLRIYVSGHTDGRIIHAGDPERDYGNNQVLSESRANAVAEVIRAALQLPTHAMEVEGFAATRPIATNETEQGMALNRRVEVELRYDDIVMPDGKLLVADPVRVVAVPEAPVSQTTTKQITLPNGGVMWAVEDPAKLDPRLDVLALSPLQVYGSRILAPVEFALYSNYRHFIKRWEISIYEGDQVDLLKPVAVVRGTVEDFNQRASWNPELAGDVKVKAGEQLWYVLRAYDSRGRVDETRAKAIDVVDTELRGVNEADESASDKLALSIIGGNNLAKQTIPVHGSRIRVNGYNLDPGYTLMVNGELVKVDTEGKFAVESHLPVGMHVLDVNVKDQNGAESVRELPVRVRGQYLFMVGMANVTIGQNSLQGSMDALGDDEHFDEDIWVDGRLAFYLKGKVKGKYLLTAQFDTKDGDIRDIGQRIKAKDNSEVFRSLDPERYYAVYGDDSTTVDDTDTQGALYLRVEWDKSKALWGNFNTGFTGTEMAEYSRSLYGAKLEHRNVKVTEFGEHVTELQLFGSEAQTAASHNEFAATGGSLYYLRDDDVVDGSEKVWVEVRSRDTEQVRNSIILVRGRDYAIDYLQGRVILTRPLSSVSNENDGAIIKDAPIEGDDVFLLVDYEYEPETFETDQVTAGARGKVWLTDHIAIGATHVSEKRDQMDYGLNGLDITLRAGENSYLRLEYAESESQQSLNSSRSNDGGLSFGSTRRADATTTTGNSQISGEAIGVEARVNLAEVSKLEGLILAWYKDKEAGFSSVARLDDGQDEKDMGVELELQVTENFKISSQINQLEREGSTTRLVGQIQGRYNLTDKVQAALEFRSEDTDDVSDADRDSSASLVGGELRMQVSERTEVYGQGQVSLKTSGDYRDNNQATLGVRSQLTSKLNGKVELTSGDRGEGVVAGVEYAVTPSMNVSIAGGIGDGAATEIGTNYVTGNGLELYGSYAINPDGDSNGEYSDSGNIFTIGARKQYGNSLKLYTENQFRHADAEAGISHVFGLDYDFSEQFRISISMQDSEVESDGKNASEFGDAGASNRSRKGVTLATQYKDSQFKFGSVLEYREDANGVDNTAEQNREVEQWVTRQTVEWRANEVLRLVGKLDLSITESTVTEDEARFAELDLGFAYRPTGNDKLNVLGNYTFIYDLPTLGQNTRGTDRREHILALEGIYEINSRWEIGAKVAIKRGDMRLDRAKGEWVETGAQLVVVRTRYHVNKAWDGLLEYRVLSTTEDDSKAGFLAALYRHFGNNMKVGVGYNFTDFSDDLTDNDYDSEGWFIDLIGKY